MAFFTFIFPRVMLVKFRGLWNSVTVAVPEGKRETPDAEFPYQLICNQKQNAAPGWPGGSIYFAPSRLVFVPYERNCLQHHHRIELGSPNNVSASAALGKHTAIWRFFFGAESALNFRGQDGEATFIVPDLEMTLEAVQTALKTLRSEGEARNA